MKMDTSFDDRFFSEFLELVRFHKLKTPLTCVLGCSGGLDSRVLLDLLIRLPRDICELSAILHVNHNLRASSSRDAEFVKELSSQNKTPFFLLDVCPLNLDVTNESWGREVRYDFFEECREKLNADFIITAHHLDDEIETFLFKLITGRNNLDLSFINDFDDSRKLIRPFLKFKKTELFQYAKSKNLMYVEDETNYENQAARNIIRNQILPYFNELNSQYQSHIKDFLDTIKQERSFLGLISEDLFIEPLSKIIEQQDVIAIRAIYNIAKSSVKNQHFQAPIRKYRELLLYLRSMPQGQNYFDMGGDVIAIVDFRSRSRQLDFCTRADLELLKSRQSQHKLFSIDFHLNEEKIFYNVASSKSCLIGVSLDEPSSRLSSAFGDFEIDKSTILIQLLKLKRKSSMVFSVKGSCLDDRVSSFQGQRSSSISKLIKNKKLSDFEKKSLLYLYYEEVLMCVIPNIDIFTHENDQNKGDMISVYLYYFETKNNEICQDACFK